jgi:hypothetical protein
MATGPAGLPLRDNVLECPGVYAVNNQLRVGKPKVRTMKQGGRGRVETLYVISVRQRGAMSEPFLINGSDFLGEVHLVLLSSDHY